MSVDSAFEHFPTLTTTRLRLREIKPQDAEALYATFSDEEVMKFYGRPPQQTPAETQEWVDTMQSRFARREGIRWGITLHGDDRVIGTCSFHRFDEGYHRVETGYEINRAYWRQGIATEAMIAVLNFGFNDMGLHRIEAVIDIQNEASKNLLVKLGFSYEGNLRQRYDMGDHFADEHYFGLLRDEWTGVPHPPAPSPVELERGSNTGGAG